MAVSALKPESVPKAATLRAIVIPGGERLTPITDGEVRIPGSVIDLASFRCWARSKEFPDRGRISYLAGELWVDLTIEQVFTHNQVKGEIAIVLGTHVKATRIGRYFHDRTRLSNPAVDLSTEPDGFFASFDSLRADRIRLVEAAEEGYIELEGTPDMVFEVVSESSVHKDTVRLRQIYWRAGIAEYWLIDARRGPLTFDILRRGRRGYVVTRGQDGWLPSTVFGRLFRLTQEPDTLGNPEYTLAVKAPE
jgi:Uma2 family endonuclease